jgi:hypothetical protein
VAFDKPYPAIPASRNNYWLRTAEVCAECQAECLEPLAQQYRQFAAGQTGLTLGAYKALIASALLIMPPRELAYFPDTIEWVNNPDATCDAGLFAGLNCRIYAINASTDSLRVNLARRVNDDAAIPYMVFFLHEASTVIQVDLPLSLRDEDLDGASIESPERSWTGRGPSGIVESHCQRLAVEIPRLRPRGLGSSVLVTV